MRRLFGLLLAYGRDRRMRFGSRAELERYQAKKLRTFMQRLSRASPYFLPWAAEPLAQWPLMDKAIMMQHFDTLNTAGLQLEQVLEQALRAEHSRDFTPTVRGITVGLSSGTSGQRGVFVVSAAEKAQWAGLMLSRALPAGLFAGERVALFLRANSNLYTAVRNRWLAFEFFDLFQPFEQQAASLAHYAPTIIVAPAQVLRELAIKVLAGELALAPQRVISVAEVLEPQDRVLIVQAFGSVHQIYQATEGFLASTCAHGVLHLNEEYVHVEPEWLDEAQQRFVPIITDFTRFTQPIVRYRLNDILVMRKTPCPCGRVTRALDAIEGRCDDLLWLPGVQAARVPVFSDVLSRALAQALPPTADYRLVHQGSADLTLEVALPSPELEAVQAHVTRAMLGLGVDIDQLRWTLNQQAPVYQAGAKRRRIVRQAGSETHTRA